MKHVSCAKLKLQVENALPKFHCLHSCLRKAAIDFGRCVHGSRKTELLTVILTCESNAPIFDEPPETSDDETYVLVEDKHPIELTPRE